jgi:hypothetical protein
MKIPVRKPRYTNEFSKEIKICRKDEDCRHLPDGRIAEKYIGLDRAHIDRLVWADGKVEYALCFGELWTRYLVADTLDELERMIEEKYEYCN